MKLNAAYVSKGLVSISTPSYLTMDSTKSFPGVQIKDEESIMSIDTFRKVSFAYKKIGTDKDFIDQINDFLEFYNSIFA
jgi:hypothetical protein